MPVAINAALTSEKLLLTREYIDADDFAGPDAHYSLHEQFCADQALALPTRKPDERPVMLSGRSLDSNQMTDLNPHIHIAIEFSREQMKTSQGGVVRSTLRTLMGD